MYAFSYFLFLSELRNAKTFVVAMASGSSVTGIPLGTLLFLALSFFFFFYRMETIHLANAKAGTRTHCPGFLLSRALSFVNAELHNIQPTLTYQQYRHKVWDAWDHNALAFLRSSVLKRLFSHSPRGFSHSLSLSGCPKALGPCRAARVE